MQVLKAGIPKQFYATARDTSETGAAFIEMDYDPSATLHRRASS